MKTLLAIAAACAVATPALAGAAPDYSPLLLYQGSWTAAGADGGKAVRLDNACGRIGDLFGCEQLVDGKPMGWILFAPAGAPGQWKTQHLSMDGASSQTSGDLSIDGPLWTYSGSYMDKGARVWTRTTNRFSGPDRIHFEIARSSDGKTWTVTRAGDEMRTPGAP